VSGDVLEKRLGYSVGMFNGNLINTGFNDNNQFTYVGRVFGTPYEGKWGQQEVKWTVGGNGFTGNNGPVSVAGLSLANSAAAADKDIFAGHRDGWGVDTQFKLGRFDLYGEYLSDYFRSDYTAVAPFNAAGWSVMGAYYVLPKKLQAVVRYETLDPSDNRKGDCSDTWTFGLNYLIKGDDIKLMVNYMLGDPTGADSRQGRFLMRVQVCF
jgi:phosphate-selective porin OprO and OprP